jgi:hypothetical protein
MKTIKMYLLSALLGMTFFQCKNSEEKIEKRTKSIIEKAAEAAGMPEVDGSNLNNTKNNKVHFDFDLTQLNPAFNFKNAFGSITANREVISIIIADEVEHGVRSITIGFTGKDLRQIKPLKAKIGSGKDVNATFNIQKLDNTEVLSFLANKGTVEVSKLSEKEAWVTFDVKLSNAMDSQDESKWMDLKGTIKIDYPMITTLGDSTSEFLY